MGEKKAMQLKKGCYSVDGLFKIADKPKKSSRTEKKDEQNKKGTV